MNKRQKIWDVRITNSKIRKRVKYEHEKNELLTL